jgi:hypothetical protein
MGDGTVLNVRNLTPSPFPSDGLFGVDKMSWPIKLRALSFAVTMAVTITESVMGSIPVAFALWYFGIASGRTVVEGVVVAVAAVSLSISIYSHARPAQFPRRAPGEGVL